MRVSLLKEKRQEEFHIITSWNLCKKDKPSIAAEVHLSGSVLVLVVKGSKPDRVKDTLGSNSEERRRGRGVK